MTCESLCLSDADDDEIPSQAADSWPGVRPRCFESCGAVLPKPSSVFCDVLLPKPPSVSLFIPYSFFQQAFTEYLL